jgi:hypothetical protein
MGFALRAIKPSHATIIRRNPAADFFAHTPMMQQYRRMTYLR